MAQTIGSIDLASLKNLRDDVTQYFWFESDSSSAWGSGAHVTLYPESQFTDSTSSNYMKGQNIIMNTDGFSIRNGALPMMALDNDSLDFNAVNTTQGTYTTMATFGLTGATIGQTSGAHSVIDADGQRFYASNGNTQLANIGYASGASAGSTPATAPYYSFGTRIGDIGNYSFAQGNNAKASGFCSHASGVTVKAEGAVSHAEGDHAEATSVCAHAEGYGTHATGKYSHAEGNSAIASGEASHAQNEGTNVKGKAQTVIGSYNIIDNSSEAVHPGGQAQSAAYKKYAFIIGNGTANDARSNALTVDWLGNVETAGQVHQTVQSVTPSISTSTGTLEASTLTRCGNLRQLMIKVSNTSATAVGGNLYVGTLSNSADRPVTNITGASYYGSSVLIIGITPAGVITVRVAGVQLGANSAATIGILYIAS